MGYIGKLLMAWVVVGAVASVAQAQEARAVAADGAEAQPRAEGEKLTICGEGRDRIPDGASVTATRRGTLVVEYPVTGEQRALDSTGGKEYYCSCGGEGGGSCYPKLVGKDVFCSSMSCSSCDLSSIAVPAVVALERTVASCGGPDGPDLPEAVADRLSELTQWQDANNFPPAMLNRGGDEATAPDGFELVMERIGGARIIYAAPAAFFDELSGELMDRVGPDNGGGTRIGQVAAGGKAKCFCGGDGGCSFTMDMVCAGTCSGRGCGIKVRGLRDENGQPVHHDFNDPYRSR